MDVPIDRSSGGVILKPCFRNRRAESSVHLKNSFPGGFKPLPASKSLSALNLKNSDSLDGPSLSLSDVHRPNSYMAWAKGSHMYSDEVFDDSQVDEKGHIDPLATMAGPYYYDLMRAKREEAARKMGSYLDAPIDPNSCLVSIESHELLLHNRVEMSKKVLAKKNRTSPPKKRIFHAPSSLPTFNTRLANSKLVSSLASDSLVHLSSSAVSQEYEQWLADRRSNNDSRAWTIRGNRPDINYSAYDFSGKEAKFCTSAILNLKSIDDSEESSINSKLHRLGSPVMAVTVNPHNLSSTKLPSLVLPPLLNVEIYTLNHVVKSKSILNTSQFISKQIPSTMTLEELKQIVIREIVLGIEKAFRITEQEINEELKGANSSSSGGAGVAGGAGLSSSASAGRISLLSNRQVAITPIDTKQIQLDFQYFNPAMQSWRDCSTEFDWLAGKQAIAEHYCTLSEVSVINMSSSTVSGGLNGPTIQLMHSLEKNSEFLLLQQIQRNYKSRRELLKLKESQVSLDNLTRKLAYPAGSAATNNSGHKFQEVTVPSYQLHGIADEDTLNRPSRSRGSNRPASSHSASYRRPIDVENVTVLKKSVLYPRADPAVVKERDEKAKLAEKQQQIAIALQNRLVKTKF